LNAIISLPDASSFFTMGVTYFQQPDLIDLIVGYNTSRKPNFPLVAFPATKQEWQHPSQAFAIPAYPDRNTFDDDCVKGSAGCASSAA
jgi:hypothetical protein